MSLLKKNNLYFIIHPNFRNGGAERSALNNMPDLILTYGKFVDREIVSNFENTKIFERKLNIFLFLIKQCKKGNLLIETNQLSACYFWILIFIPRIKVIHSQRLSLKGEILLSKSILKRFLNLIFFKLAPLLVQVRIPSEDLKNDYCFYKNNIIYKPNRIFNIDKINFEISKKKSRDIVIVSRDGKEKKLYETLSLLNDVLIKKRKVTIIGSIINKNFEKLDINYIECIIERNIYYETLSHHKVGILFSAAEGFGNVIPEYIFCNVWPIVNNCQWGPSETIKKYKVGNILNWDWDEDMQKIKNKSRIIDEIIESKNPINEKIRNKVRNHHQ